MYLVKRMQYPMVIYIIAISGMLFAVKYNVVRAETLFSMKPMAHIVLVT